MGGDIKKQCDTCQHCLIGYVELGPNGDKCAVESAVCLGVQRFGMYEYNLWKPKEEPKKEKYNLWERKEPFVTCTSCKHNDPASDRCLLGRSYDCLGADDGMRVEHEPQEEKGGRRVWLELQDDPISPNHYTRLDPEPIRVTMAWGLDHYRACALKYIARAEFHEKGAKVNIEKAIRYLRYYLENLENQEKKNDM